MDILIYIQRLQRLEGELPFKLQEAIDQSQWQNILDIIAKALLEDDCTDALISCCEGLLPDLCERIKNGLHEPDGPFKVQRAYASILSLAPYLAERVLDTISQASFQQRLLESALQHEHDYLVSLMRLLHFDHARFRQLIPLSQLGRFANSTDHDIRYLSSRVIAMTLGASENLTNIIAGRWTGDDKVHVTQEEAQERKYDDRFLALREHKRFRRLRKAMDSHPTYVAEDMGPAPPVQIHDAVANIGGVLLPRGGKQSSTAADDELFVYTDTSKTNLRAFALALRTEGPVLLTGASGSGKTRIIRHVATELGKARDTVTLHLNEQSDAKSLLGIYTSGKAPGSFEWRPGVLTKAVTEGFWVILEDLDRTPSEVMSVLLPLIERRELAIPGRQQVVKAAFGFRLLATARTYNNDHNSERKHYASNILGVRHWREVAFESPTTSELAKIISQTYPQMRVHTNNITRTYDQLQALQKSRSGSASGRSAALRTIGPRELLAWASRMALLVAPRTTLDTEMENQICLAGLDCLAGFLPDGPLRDEYASCIAQNCGIGPQRLRFLLSERTIACKVDKELVSIGSYQLRKQNANRSMRVRSKTFSMNKDTSIQVERIAAAVASREPLLLVGETGTGKTTSIQYLADMLGKRLTPYNMSQQSECGDLIGGYKPVNTRSIIIPLQDEFDYLFSSTLSVEENQPFLNALQKCIVKQQWVRVCECWQSAWTMLEKLIRPRSRTAQDHTSSEGSATKKRRLGPTSPLSNELENRWTRFRFAVADVKARLASGADTTVAFSFVEGGVVKAAREGDWILLDEINLASPDTLESLADLFDKQPSIMLSEAGSTERISAHPDFRIFAAMNPATDVGKKDLTPSIRSKFTELYVESPEKDLQSLQQIVQTYLGTSETELSETASRLHQQIQKLNGSGSLADGAGQKPHFSLRTLARVLLFARDISTQCSLRRALHEGFSMSYLTMLDAASALKVRNSIDGHFYGGKNSKRVSELRKHMNRPTDIAASDLVQIGPYWVRKGGEVPQEQKNYIKTPSVQSNLDKLIRAAMTRRFPILLQGPTSSGKTSMIEYLAKETGHKFVRINNHDSTDLQEYLGSYVSGTDGKITFQEGLLVEAVRLGHWLVLDELNLAPTDVLEALNRLLDDNRELLIPDTQEIVRPHSNFMLFATQNPAGVYGGRKVLSRAFRNRFLELHFDDIPVDELQTILVGRSDKPASWCELIVKVYKELSLLRQSGMVFEQRGFATLRDLFRWALRPADNVEDLANNGFMLLAERCRKPSEKDEIRNIIESVLGKKSYRLSIKEHELYERLAGGPKSTSIVWTKAMKRLYSLTTAAIANNEPVLLVGETGSGKTTVCQVIAQNLGRHLHVVNAHQNTEAGDLIGAQRPARNRAAAEKKLRQLVEDIGAESIQHALDHEGLEAALKMIDNIDVHAADSPIDKLTALKQVAGELKVLFEWVDGSLVQAMKKGELFLLDEISLAEDSVLERLNSVLEPSRSILLAEKGSVDSFVVAQPDFQFFATMNPGGDYGKRELSPALRNRFTEIWVPPMDASEDCLQVVRAKLIDDRHAKTMLRFAYWFQRRYHRSSTVPVHIRDVLAWTDFMNTFEGDDGVKSGLMHGAAMVFIDSIGADPSGMVDVEDRSVLMEREICFRTLENIAGLRGSDRYTPAVNVSDSPERLLFLPQSVQGLKISDFMTSDTVASNTVRVARALRLPKPVLIEGAPGVGKTTLVADLARWFGKPLTRINLSEQTDLMDLFGADAPVEDSGPGHFSWRDAPFLRAMKRGEWVLLDEMNLASQSVLEGLNACLDHRGEVYIPELNKSFSRHPKFRLFAAQNPHHQGGGRKGLPASFVNRFTVVYADPLDRKDLRALCTKLYPDVPLEINYHINKLVMGMTDIADDPGDLSVGGPWQFNLRDSKRWLELVNDPKPLLQRNWYLQMLPMISKQRFRSPKAPAILNVGLSDLGVPRTAVQHDLFHAISKDGFQVGFGLMPRVTQAAKENQQLFYHYDMRPHLDIIESVLISMQRDWPILLVGPSGCGKTALLGQLAVIAGVDLVTFPVSSDVDSADLVGSYEQFDGIRVLQQTVKELREAVRNSILQHACEGTLNPSALSVWSALNTFDLGLVGDNRTWLDDLIARVRLAGGEGMVALQKNLDDLCSMSLNLASTESTRFQWTDSVLLRAMQEGSWLILDNANLCSPAALDRLNSVLEPNGTLLINEHAELDGSPRIVRPHPKFRLILTMDPKHGELSPALRNRCVELYMPQSDHPVDPDAAVFGDSLLDRIESVRTPLVAQNVEIDTWADLEGLSNVPQSALINTSHYGPMISTSLEMILDHLYPANGAPSVVYEFNQQVLEGSRRSSDVQAVDLHALSSNNPLSNPAVALACAGAMDEKQSVVNVRNRINFHEFSAQVRQMREALDRRSRGSASVKDLTHLQRSRAGLAGDDAIYRMAIDLLRVIETLTEEDYIRQWKRDRRHGQPPHSGSVSNIDLISVSKEEAHVDKIVRLWWDLIFYTTQSAETPISILTHLDQRIQSSLVDFPLAPPLGSQVDVPPMMRSLNLDAIRMAAVIWEIARPAAFTPSTPEPQCDEFVATLRTLVKEFDNAIMKTDLGNGNVHSSLAQDRSPLDVRDVVKLRTSFAKSMRLTWGGSESHLPFLRTIVDGVVKAGVRSATTSYLATSFKQVYRRLELVKATEPSAVEQMDEEMLSALEIFAGCPLSRRNTFLPTERLHKEFPRLPGILEYVSNYNAVGSADLSTKLNRRLSALISEQSDSLHMVPIELLDTARIEISTLGRILATNANTFVLGVAEQLHTALYDALHGLLTALVSMPVDLTIKYSTREFAESMLQILTQHRAFTKVEIAKSNKSFRRVYKVQDGKLNSVPRLFHESIRSSVIHFQTWPESITCSRAVLSLSKAWGTFALGMILLYIPATPFDPAMDSVLEHERHQRYTDNVRLSLEAMREFELNFTGAKSSTRIKREEAKFSILANGTPRKPAVWRSKATSFTSLSSIFSQVRATMQPYVKNMMNNGFEDLTGELQLHKNIAAAKNRLHDGFSDMRDLTAPLRGFLSSLEIAIDLQRLSQSPSWTAAVPRLERFVPLAGYPYEALNPSQVFKHTDSFSKTSPMLFLRMLRFIKSHHVERFRQAHGMGMVIYTLSKVHEQWRVQLDAEQKATAAKSSTYRYNGGDEMEDVADAELVELFPDYEGAGEANVDRPAQNLQLQAKTYSDLLDDIVGPIVDPQDSLADILMRLQEPESHEPTHHMAPDPCLPLSICRLHTVSQRLQSNAAPQQPVFNIYEDANVNEIQRMAILVNKVRSRFTIIQRAWPDHATPMDVLRTCDELVTFAHTAPLMKIITKLEKLHDYIHQWQTVTSTEFSAVAVYDAVTDLIVSWRRLELSTWSHLLDHEVKKCEDEAKSWFFLAFESIISASRNFDEPGDALQRHVVELLKTLESFLLSTGLGQFRPRLQILTSLHRLLREDPVVTNDVKKVLFGALSNLIGYFRTFEIKIQESLAVGRRGLDKEMKDVIQLASWKDRNILALRKSAKNSHRKLFKVIRKFRAILQQPVERVVAQGVPDLSSTSGTSCKPRTHPQIDSTRYVVQCQEIWDMLPARFSNVSTSTQIMASATEIWKDKLESSSQAAMWLNDLKSSAETLRKATPDLMTEEHRATAQHLKTRKRGLFAHTLRTLRKMGFKSNLGTDALSHQDSMAATLASIAFYDTSCTARVQQRFYQLLQIMPKVRDSAHQYSADLTGPEVKRSIALLESMLQNTLTTKSEICAVLTDVDHSDHWLQRLEDLARLDQPLTSETTLTTSHIEDQVPVLLSVLRNSKEMMIAQFSLAQEDGTEQLAAVDEQIGVVTRSLETWRRYHYPKGLSSQESRQACEDLVSAVDTTREILEDMIEDNPPLEPLLSQTLRWASFDQPHPMIGPGPLLMSLDLYQSLVVKAVEMMLNNIKPVRACLAKLPSTVEEPSWLVMEASLLSCALKGLGMPQINALADRILDSMAYVPKEAVPQATAFLLAAQPIFSSFADVHARLSQRLLDLHTAMVDMTASLAQIFVNLATDGFCSPREKDQQSTGNDSGVEAGTGLGDGEGAEDISKDIGDDEDLTELAQEPNQKKGDGDEKIEDERDAVDMADQDLEGEYGEEQEKAGEDEMEGEGEDQDIESEVGSVDDLGEGTIDEKMWDDGGKTYEGKEQKADKAEGTKSEDLAAAGEEKQGKEDKKSDESEAVGEDVDMEDVVGAEEEEHNDQREAEQADPTMQQEENLDLPEDMEMEGQDSKDNLEDDMSVQDEAGETEANGDDMKEGDVDEPESEDAPVESQTQQESTTEEDSNEATRQAGEEAKEDDQVDETETPLQDNRQDESEPAEQVASTAAQGNGLDQDEAPDPEDRQEGAASAQKTPGEHGENATNEDVPGVQGQRSDLQQQENYAEDNQDDLRTARDEVKRLGDAMETWYKQHRQIHEAMRRPPRNDSGQTEDSQDVEFEHLGSDDSDGDTQALGAAREDEASALDEDEGTAVNERDVTNGFLEQDPFDSDNEDEDTSMQDVDYPARETSDDEAQDEQPRTMVGERSDSHSSRSPSPATSESSDESVESIESTAERFSTTTITAARKEPQSLDEAFAVWSGIFNRVWQLSLQLKEQLSLILHPTAASKLRGDFRTGKRLNIKRIIPYIASNYKRDKIWLRRSMPSKREYQIILAVDSSKSMEEAGAGMMALETVVLVGKALSELEAGELAVVGFGTSIQVPVKFGETFVLDRGGHVVQQLAFDQAGTDVRGLLEKTGEMFTEGRRKTRVGTGVQTWQLMLVIGDGVFDDEEGVRRAERRLRDEGVMVVFVVVDAHANADRQGQKTNRASIVDLKSTTFTKDADGKPQVKISRYMENFPFRYYLIVRNVAELPNVLAGALRQWFAEVAESG